MTMVPRCLLLILTVFAAGLAGCSGAPPTPPKPDSTSVPAVPVKPVEANANPPSGNETPATTEKFDENSAAAAITATLKALKEGDLADAYDFLPPTYQADIDGLIHEFADRMDPEVWSELMSTARKGIGILRAKKDSILALDLFRDRPEAEPYRKHWDSTVQLLETVVASDAADLSKLKQATGRSLLPGKVTSALPQFEAITRALGATLARQFDGVRVTAVRTDGANQVVTLQGPDDDEPAEITYVQHEGRWLPKSLVDHWSEGIAADREWLKKLPDRIKVIKPRVLDSLNEANQILDQLASAANRDQFEQAAGPAILSLALAWPNLQMLARQAMTGQSELPHVTISINRELTDRELNGLTASILKPLQESGSDYTLLSNDGRTICRLSRITDLESIRDRLTTHFAVLRDDVTIDRSVSTINVRLAP